MINKINLLNFSFSIFIILFFSCASNQLKYFKLQNANPTEYIYNENMINVKKAIYKAFSNRQFKNLQLWSMEKKIEMTPINFKKIYLLHEKVGNKNSFLLDNMMLDIGYSKTYLSIKGDSLEYMAQFYLKLDSIGMRKTKVKIYTILPEVIIGKEKNFGPPPHFARGYKTRSIDPSTIEEYEILFRIGKELGIQGMPKLILPNTESIIITK